MNWQSRHSHQRALLGALACVALWSGGVHAEPLRFDCNNPHIPLYVTMVGEGASPAAAFQDAQHKVKRDLCPKGVDCTPILATFKPYGIDDTSPQRICARIVALSEAYLDARKGVSSLDPLLRRLREAAQSLATRLGAKKLSPRVVLTKIRDEGGYLGDRVERFRAWIELAFSETPGIQLQVPGRDRHGNPTAAANQIALFANIIERPEGGTPSVEIQLYADLPNKERLPLPLAIGPKAALIEAGIAAPVPVAGARKELLEDPELTVDLDVGEDGFICEGEETQLTITPPRPMHVRVFNLFGDDGLLAFPNRHHSTDLMENPTPLFTGKGIRFVMAPGADHERYLVIASDTYEGLGPWGRFTNYCRLRPEHIRALIDAPATVFGKALVSDMSFRVTRDSCASVLTDTERQAAFATLPEYCPL